jgi:hypothetical protein
MINEQVVRKSFFIIHHPSFINPHLPPGVFDGLGTAVLAGAVVPVPTGLAGAWFGAG